MTSRSGQLNAIQEAALLLLLRAGRAGGGLRKRRQWLSYGRNSLYADVDSGTAHALQRRGLAELEAPRPGLMGWTSGGIRLTEAGELRAELIRQRRLQAEAERAELIRQRRLRAMAELDLSPPRRGHLRLVQE